MRKPLKTPWIGVIVFFLVYAFTQRAAEAVHPDSPLGEMKTLLSVGPILFAIIVGYIAQKLFGRKAKPQP